MALIDTTTNLGKLRLRVADFGDISHLPDSVYLQTLVDNNDNLNAAAKTCAYYILGILSQKTDRRMGLQLEVKGSQAYAHYRDFLMLAVNNPAFVDYSPIPYQSLDTTQRDMLEEFVSDWNRCYYNGTQSQAMAVAADIGPNDGSRYGPLGSNSAGWEVP